MSHELTFIDLFSGAGGLSLGLEQAGMRGLLAIDFDTDSVDTYTKNFNHPALLADVSTLNRQRIGELVGGDRISVIAGGPPCQGFSVQRRGSDEDDRNKLITEFGRIVSEVQPEAFVMENVMGLLSVRGKALC